MRGLENRPTQHPNKRVRGKSTAGGDRSEPVTEFEIGRILYLRSEISKFRDWTSHWTVQFEISDFGFEMQDLSDFKILGLVALAGGCENPLSKVIDDGCLIPCRLGECIHQRSSHHRFFHCGDPDQRPASRGYARCGNSRGD